MILETDEHGQLWRYSSTGQRHRAFERTCQQCGEVFGWVPKWGFGLYCSTACANKADKPRRNRRGDAHPNWKGGRHVGKDGYVWVNVGHHPGAYGNKYMLEHRYLISKLLGRPLEDWETVHHINGDKQDNRLENLQLRSGRHGKGSAWRCADCGSHNIEAEPLAE